MHSIWQILLWLPIVGGVGLFWFLSDMRFAQRWSLKRAELGAQDKWRELNAHFESGIKCRRPMLLLFQRFVIPGLLEADYALHLSNQGEHERALVLAEKAARKSSRRPKVQIAILPAQATILLRLGRYADAKEVVRFGRSLAADPDRSELNKAQASPDGASNLAMQEGLIELSLGNLDAALQLGIEASAGAVSDPARALISGVLMAKGRFQEALDALLYEPSGFDKFLKPDELKLVAEDKMFQETARKMDEQLSSVFGPAINLGMALVYVDAGDAEKLGAALERTRSELKSNQIMEHIFVRTRACWHAMNGDVAGVEADLTRARQLTDEKPASRSAKYEYHLAAGRARFLLGQYDAAIDELGAAARLVLHPMEKHTSTYWLARANQAANQPSASSLFKAVIADGFATWMETDSRARSTSLEMA